jgi:membrane-associated HD superfamily phosphohydrolase
MKEQKYIDDLKDIREIMDRSSRFISLSGLSGVFTGVFALIGAYAAYKIVFLNQDYLVFRQVEIATDSLNSLLLIAFATLTLSVGISVFFTTKEAKKRKQKLWDNQTRRLLINLAIPLVTGGILCLVFLFGGYIGIIGPFTLIFYGLALVNASKYTLTEIRSLGMAEIVLGLAAVHFIELGLLFWAVGFGLLHIVYGIVMQIRYKL